MGECIDGQQYVAHVQVRVCVRGSTAEWLAVR